MNQYLNKLIMYHEIHKMNREGFSKSKISQYLVVNRRTVKRILSMDELQFEVFLDSLSQRSKELSSYEGWVKAKLEIYQETSAAQMHDGFSRRNSQNSLQLCYVGPPET
jgi:hypothetical protein